MRILLALGMILVAATALADQTTQRTTYGMSLSLQGQLLDLNAPICSPATGSYSVAYRNSIATGCDLRKSDDFATLLFTGSSPATYTMPQSKVTTFTGSISGITLTTPANAVIIGSVITGAGVSDNTYVIASTNSTTWTVNNSQTVGSETLTQSVFPPGHGTCFKSDTSATAVLTVTATTSTISGAAGVSGQLIPVYPGGEVCLQATVSNNYEAMGYLPGVAPSWAFVNAGSCVSSGGPACTTGTVNMVGADLIIVAVTWLNNSGTMSAPSDSSSNTYTQAVSISNTDSNASTTKCYYKQAPAVSSSMTFTSTGTAYPEISVAGFSGSVATPLDQTNSANSANVAGTSQQPGSITPTQANELVVACLGIGDSANTSGVAVNSGYTIEGAQNFVSGTTMGGALAYFVQTNAAATNPTFTWTGTVYSNAGIMSFK